MLRRKPSANVRRDCRMMGNARPTTRALLVCLIGCLVALAGHVVSFAQIIPSQAYSGAALPEPIYWKQQLFLIPYQWGSAAEPGAARAVWLFLSKDRGASWQKISEAKPDVKAFNYRAEGDGEFWFAVRTFDKLGHAWPQGPYQPELRVVVDTTVPRIDLVGARVVDNGIVDIQGRANDANLDGNTWKFEWQADPTGPWQPVMLQKAGSNSQSCLVPAPSSTFHATWQPPAGARPVALRGIILDRAGNSATYQTRVELGAVVTGTIPAAPVATAPAAFPQATSAPSISAPALSQPTLSGPWLSPPVVGSLPAAQAGVQPPPMLSAPSVQNSTSNVAPPITVATPLSGAPDGWASAGTATISPATVVPQTVAAPATQPWPASNVSQAPFRLWTGGAVPHDDGVTAYGSPPLFAAPPALPQAEPQQDAPRVNASFTSAAKPAENTPTISITAPTVAAPPTAPRFAALEPYRETTSIPLASPTSSFAAPSVKPSVRDVTPVDSSTASAQHSPTSAPKLVGSRTFALEYDLDDAGRGVTKVELWGTRDGGQNWIRYAVDDDNRSPLIATVDEEGVYGFRILVQNAGAAFADPPRNGEAPELWVSVDLKRPVVELTAIERGQGNLADHLKLQWRAVDNNLDSRPIALFYSSRPSGPWSAIATNLENTGEYAWRVERHVPSRFYLRVEARDVAGNLAAYQTREAVEFSTSNIAGRLRSAQPVGPAVGANDSYR